MHKAGIDEKNLPEINDIVNLLIEYLVIEKFWKIQFCYFYPRFQVVSGNVYISQNLMDNSVLLKFF